jgi:hypothetical protein
MANGYVYEGSFKNDRFDSPKAKLYLPNMLIYIGKFTASKTHSVGMLKYPNGEIRLENRDYKKIKNTLMRRHLNGGLPDIKLTEPNYDGRGIMMLQHESDGRGLY